MTPPNNGQFSQRFEENTSNFAGSKARSTTSKSKMTTARESAMQQVYDVAKQNGVSTDAVVTTVLKNSLPELRAYIMSKGETPVKDYTGQMIQAVLLRANDVATTAGVLDVSDEDALQTIESAENEAVDTNSPEQDNVMSIPVQGAISCALQYLSDQSGGKSMSTIIKGVHNAAKSYRSGGASNFMDDTGDPTDSSDWLDWLDPSTTSDPSSVSPVDTAAADNSLSYASIGSSLASIPAAGSSSITVAGNVPTISAGASTVKATGSTTTDGGIFSGLSSLLSGITSVANQVTSAANSSAGAAGAIKNAVSNVGANSIATYIKNNQTSVIIVALIIIAVVFAAIYAAKRK